MSISHHEADCIQDDLNREADDRMFSAITDHEESDMSNDPGTNSSNTNHTHPWAVTLDGVVEETHASRAAAREHAAWVRRHPSTQDRVRYGSGGVVRVIDRRPR